jgi:cell division protein FtsL
MQLCKFFKIMGIVIVLALAYIHMQMQIVDLAYQGNKKEQEIRTLVEENGSATYKILMLKSANHLGLAMLKEDSDMQFADANDIVKIVAAEDALMEDDQLGQHPKLAKQTNPLFSLLSLGVEAEAKTAE